MTRGGLTLRLRLQVTGRVSQRDVVDHLSGNRELLALLDKLATRVQRVARTLVGVKTGTLLATIRKNPGRTPRGPHVDVTAGHPGVTPYMWWHHQGTPPHVIVPRRKQALRFTSGGRVIFATKVNHPGTVGTKFLTRALDAL